MCAILLLSSIGANACAAETEFAVASIRPSDPNGPATRPRTGPMAFFRRASLKDLIALAYDIEKFQIVGGPNWLEQQRYDVALRANIAETLLVHSIREQGGKEIQHEEYEDILSGPVGRAQ